MNQFYGQFCDESQNFFYDKKNPASHRGLRPQVYLRIKACLYFLHAFGLNPPSHLVLRYHWLAFLKQVLGFKNLSSPQFTVNRC